MWVCRDIQTLDIGKCFILTEMVGLNYEVMTTNTQKLPENLSKSASVSISVVHPLSAPAPVSPTSSVTTSSSSSSVAVPPVSVEPPPAVVHPVHATRGRSHSDVDVVSDDKLAVVESLGVVRALASEG